MPIKLRTLESYLAGVGASGALIAGAFVAFVILVGIVTFDAWPTGSSVFNRGAGDVTVDTRLTTPPAREAKPPNLVKLLGGGPAGATAPARLVSVGGSAPSGPSNGSGNAPGQPQPQGNNPGGQQAPAQPNQPAQPTAPAQPVSTPTTSQSPAPNVVQDTVSGLGNTLQSDTDSLGNTLGGQNSLLGGLVGGLGNTLNNTLQGLAGR
jgi:hypothetical protein